MLELKPDIILSTRSADECTKLQEDIKIPVIGVYSQDEICSENFYKNLRIVGQVVGTKEIVENKIKYIKELESELSKININKEKEIYSVQNCTRENEKIIEGFSHEKPYLTTSIIKFKDD